MERALVARAQQSQQSQRSNRSNRSKDLEASRSVTTQASSYSRQCSSMESTISPPSPAGSLGLERKKSVTFGVHEVLLLDEDSGRREIQSYQIDGMDWKESSDLGDCDLAPPPPPHPFAPDHGLEDHLQ